VPRNLLRERARVLAAFTSGQSPTPHWTYARSDHSLLRKTLATAAQRLSHETHPVAKLYEARARELELEAALATEVGTTVLGPIARARFRSHSPSIAGEATILARRWIAEAHNQREARVSREPSREGITPGGADDPSEAARVESDAVCPGSLLTRMREEVSRRGLPFAVVVQPTLAALAATGERHILIAAGRKVTPQDVERTVMHEIEAHAVPRTRASQARLALFQIGTARGIDDQEGFALVLEERGQFLSCSRKQELAARHLAVEAMDGGATFPDVLSALVRDHGLGAEQAVLVAERAFRGGDGVSAGLGRERVYLESFLRVRAHLEEHPTDEGILTSGQVSLDAIAALAPLVHPPKIA